MNFSRNRATGHSPYVRQYGMKPVFSCDKKYDKAVSYNLINILDQRKINFEKYSKKEISKNTVKKKEYKIGDRVLKFVESKENKLGSNWIEGYVVEEILSEHAYVLKKDGKSSRVNERHIRLDTSQAERGMLGVGPFADI